MADLPEARIVKDGGPRPATAGDAPAHVLRLAPRALPWRLVWRLWFGGTLGMFGWFFAGFGLLFCLIFLPLSELWTPDYDRTATATITRVEETSTSENDQTIYEAHYTFVDERGVTRTGSSYTKDPSPGGTREVEYLAEDPDDSRLVGMRSRPFGWWAGFVLIFPIVGLAIAIPQLVAGRRAVRLLRHGVETRGRLVRKEATNVTVNKRPVMALTFRFDVGGRTHGATVKTLNTAPLEDDAEEPMLYDPYDPSRATTLDHLPGSPRVTSDGRIDARPGIAIHVLIMPAVTAVLLLALIAMLAAR